MSLRDTNRRGLIGGGAVLAALALAAPLAARRTHRFFAPGDPALGLQIYTLGPEALKDLDTTFSSIARIGYRSIELLFFLNHSPTEVRVALDRAGLVAPSLHSVFMETGNGYSLGGDLAPLIAGAHQVRSRYIIASLFDFPARFSLPKSAADFEPFINQVSAAMTADDWKAYADKLNAKGAILKQHGLMIGHHNHNVDHHPIGDTTGWDTLVQHTDPALVTFELDIGWVAAAGLDPVAVFERYPGRFKLMHIKDIKRGNQANYTLKMDPAVVGEGGLDFPKILKAARAAGVEHFYVEQEPPFTIPRIEAARRSYDFLSRLP